MTRRAGAAAWFVGAVVLLALAAWCLVRGIDVRSWTGGLLVAPVRQVRLHGGWLAGATAAVTVAVLVAVEGVSRMRTCTR